MARVLASRSGPVLTPRVEEGRLGFGPFGSGHEDVRQVGDEPVRASRHSGVEATQV